MAADQERADRIRALKLARPDLTWRRIADHVGVSERAASDWQKKGGIEYANAEKLARLFEVDVDYIWRGTQSDTPDLFAGDASIEDRLGQLAEQIAADRADREANVADVKALITAQNKLITAQNKLLAKQEGILEEIRDATTMQQATARHLEEMTQAAVDAMPVPSAIRAPRKARTGTSRGS